MSEHKIVAYRMECVASSGASTIQTVSDLLKEGWQPYGSPTGYSGAPGYSTVWQAFVKYEKDSA